MPWNDNADGGKSSGPGPWGGQGGGGQGGGPNNPWGGRQGGPGRAQGPDLEELMKRFGGGRRGGRGGGGLPNFSGAGIGIVAALAVMGWLATGIYSVDAGEEAVIKQFGKYSRVTGAGIGWHLPAPIETQEIVNVQRVNRIDIGGSGRDGVEEARMLTGDENIADIDFAVFWQVADSRDFLYYLRNQNDTIKAISESAMREVVGRRRLVPIITTERDAVQQEARDLIQANLNAYKAGVTITQVQLTDAGPPREPEVVNAFRDVQSAEQDAETAKNGATKFANETVQNALGEAAKMRAEARAYRDAVVSEANGDASRFNAIYDEYRQAPQVIRDRMLIETMEQVLGRTNKIILDDNAGAVPYLPLNDLVRPGSRPANPSQASGGGQ